jgi:hypothetical protein
MTNVPKFCFQCLDSLLPSKLLLCNKYGTLIMTKVLGRLQKHKYSKMIVIVENRFVIFTRFALYIST